MVTIAVDCERNVKMQLALKMGIYTAKRRRLVEAIKGENIL